MKQIKQELARLPRDIKASPMYKRLNEEQMHFVFVQQAEATPVEERSVKNNLYVPGIEELYSRGWAKWLDLEAPYGEMAVKEFLATMEVIYDENDEGNERGVGVYGLVNGTRVEITTRGSNEYFGCEVVRPVHLKEVDGVMDMIEHREGYGRIISKEVLVPCFTQRFASLYEHYTTKAKVVTMIVFNRVYSRATPKHVLREKLALVYGILNADVMVDLGFHVTKNLMELCERKKTICSVMYPRLITLFCKRAVVEVSSYVPNLVYTENQFRRTKGYEMPSTSVGKPKRSREVQEEDVLQEDTSMRTSISIASVPNNEVRQEALFARQDAFMERMETFMANQARFMERFEATWSGSARTMDGDS